MNTKTVEGTPNAAGLRIAVVCSLFNEAVGEGLLAGALAALAEAGAEDVTVAKVPGAFELPLVAGELAAEGYDAVVALGAVIQGETDHYEHIAHRASEGLMQVMLDHGVPVTFGVLTTRERAHATARSQSDTRNKGGEAARAAVVTADLLRRLR